MGILPVVIGGALLYTMSKKGSAASGSEDFQVLTNPNVITPKAGDPLLKIDKVRKLLNRVDFSFYDGKETREFQHKWKGGTPTQNLVGKFMVRAVTEIEADPKNPGQFKEGAVMITVQEPGKGVKYAKRVLVNEGKVIDIK